MSAQVLSFNSKNSNQDVHRYIVLQASIDEEADERFALSPEVMHWRDDLWIIDLGRTRRYWTAQSMGQNIKLKDLLEKQVTDLGISIKRWIHSEHPWQALFLLAELPESTKIYNFTSNFCQNTAKRLGWESWLKEADTLKDHLEAQLKASKLQRFQSKKSQLLRAMARLGLENIYDIKEADSSSMQKRFGYWISKLWEWSFPEKNNDMPLFSGFNDLNEFVWVAEKPKCLPKVFRSLEYSVEQWDSLTDFLKEDLNLLRHKYFRQKKKSICQLSWSIELYGGSRLSLSVDFRNPYPIFNDAPEFTAALSQAKFQFEAWQASLKEEKSFSDFPEAYKIVAWDLEVTKTIYCELSEQSLENSHQAASYHRILELENKLPQAIKQYQGKNSFLIGSYRQKKTLDTEESSHQEQWKSAASLRPLFHYRNIRKLKKMDYYSVFLERNARDWWQDKNSQYYSQDFFKTERSGSSYWVVKNNQGDLFELASFD